MCCGQMAQPSFYLKTLPLLDEGDDVAMVLSPQAAYNLDPWTDIFNHANQHFFEYMQPGADCIGGLLAPHCWPLPLQEALHTALEFDCQRQASGCKQRMFVPCVVAKRKQNSYICQPISCKTINTTKDYLIQCSYAIKYMIREGLLQASSPAPAPISWSGVDAARR